MNDMIIKSHEIILLFGTRIIAAGVIFLVGRLIAKSLKMLTRKIMEKSKVDETLISFIENFVYIGLMAFIITAALGKLGIQTASFIAVLGAAGLAVGMALQGSLSNFAAGVLLIIFKPFKVNDYIEGAGTAGIVENIQIFTTQLKTPDNKIIIIPNSKLTSDNIVNYSAKETRKLDMIFGVSYNDDIDKVKNVLQDIIANEPRILKDPVSFIGVKELAESSVNFVVRLWVKTSDYWDVYFHLNETVKKCFDLENISIPYPQKDVHLFKHEVK